LLALATLLRATLCALEMNYEKWPRAWRGRNLFVPQMPAYERYY